MLAKELVRKTIHLGTALVPAGLSLHYGLTVAALGAMLGLYIVAESLRRRGRAIPVISALTEAAARTRDEHRFVLGPVTLAAGVLLTALLFPPGSAAVGIYALAFGDGSASLVGRLWGRTANPFVPEKTVAGTLACFVAVFLSTLGVTGSSKQALLIALVAMCLEMVPLKDFDNLLIPQAVSAAARAL
jgi:dolichol kinase